MARLFLERSVVGSLLIYLRRQFVSRHENHTVAIGSFPGLESS